MLGQGCGLLLFFAALWMLFAAMVAAAGALLARLSMAGQVV
jgi:hypothetical protein